MAIEKLSVILELVTGNYNKEAKQAADSTGKIGNSAKTVTGSLSAMIGPAAIGGAIVGLGKMALAAGENADRLFDLAAQTGLTTDELQEWEFVAKAAGASTEVFSDAVKAVIKNLSEAAQGTGASAEAYETLGISVKGANGELRDAGELTAEVFEKLSGMENITARNALAQDIFGKKWEETISVLDMGSEALSNLREEGKAGVVSAESLRNADKFRETWQKFLATVGPKLNDILGKIAPALTEVAEGAIEALDAMEPLIDALGFIAEKFGQSTEAIEAGRDAQSVWAQGWAAAADVGKGAIFGMVGVLGALFDEENALRDNSRDVTQEIHDSWVNLDTTWTPIIENAIVMLDRQGTSHRNVAKAADTQRAAMINLANAQAGLLDPVSNVLRLQQDLTAAQEALAEAQADGKTPANELALAVNDVAIAAGALQAAGLALTPDQIQAFAQTLMTQLDMSETQVLDLLEKLNLLDGWQGSATFTLEMNTVASGGGGSGNINTDILGFASGGVVPGWRGQPQMILAHGGEVITPAGAVTNNKTGPTINVYSPTNNLAADLQYASILSNLETLVS